MTASVKCLINRENSLKYRLTFDMFEKLCCLSLVRRSWMAGSWTKRL